MDKLGEWELAEWKEMVNQMSHEDMAKLWRFHTPGSTPIFITGTPLWEHFKKKWDKLGGWNPSLSKRIGW